MKTAIFILGLFLLAAVHAPRVHAACVDNNYKLICNVSTAPVEDCVYVGTLRPCRGPAAATSECGCATVTTPPDQREGGNVSLQEIANSALPTFRFKEAKIGDIVSALVPSLLTIAGLLLLLYLIFGGFSLMMSRGDPKAMEAAKGKITNAAIGFAIVFTAYWLVQLLSAILGLKGFGGIFK